MVHSSTMKRKRCQSPAESLPSKKVAQEIDAGSPGKICQLICILQQYGLLVGITKHLFPKDLHALAATSKATYNAIFPRNTSRCSLLKKMPCDGRGVAIRNDLHKRSQFSQGAVESNQCGTVAKNRKVESRPCVKCKVTTCDECRIHCVYQSIRHPADEPDEFDNYSGFVLLDETEMGVLSHSHMFANDDLPNGAARWGELPHHDQGFLDIPLDSPTFVSPVEIEELISMDLGMRPIAAEVSSGIAHPSSILRAFWDITEKRKRPCCKTCLSNFVRRGDKTHTVCDCTLKSQFLDRWLCLRCYQLEQKTVEESTEGVADELSGLCNCGETLDDETERVICLWCYGEVTNPWGVIDVQSPTSTVA
ncbi:hypothetical protein BU24DRAFT_71491 [Aaosphaeria arxii CBS 175.79]|uniref:Uncharacterized protein n=1 Tax=Aaosphaeria arxii CBS 175.79 TaxID=1450172 RepID=A0A6A5XAP4_9PLEO|nr:uncharacterized protein BU24DRAFT_71491 [Aaosphaeria arxii CBS 175.79]KAF2010135.1 hypothetical protein BU24DRAFT_71491 [Aaosphaeria arxii CBS 175.79]